MSDRRRKRLFQVLFALFALAFVVSVSMIGWNIYQSRKADAAFDDLRQKVQQEAGGPSVEEGYQAMRALNSDYSGWLAIPGTALDYPVMYTPDAPDYYLRRAFDQSPSASGTPFIGEGSTPDSDCLLIYGHDMDNGAMFGSLENYADPAYRASHPEICYYIENEARRYEVFAAIKTRVLAPSEEGFRYYNAAGDLDAQGFQALSDWLVQNALYDTGIRPAQEEQILILSTCSYHTENGRFLVAARRVE